MKNKVENMDIDLVYLWVDGNDPAWQAKRNAFIGKTDESSPINCKGRYANNDELKYSLYRRDNSCNKGRTLRRSAYPAQRCRG